MMVLQFLVLVCLAAIYYQDLKYRAVYWFCFPVLAVLLFILKHRYTDIKILLFDSLVGFSFICSQLALVWLYFSIKHKKLINITANYLGLGDILFLLVIPLYLSPVNYVLFYVGSLILTLIYSLLQQKRAKANNFHIPLAGLQSAILALTIICSMAFPGLKLYTDDWIYGI